MRNIFYVAPCLPGHRATASINHFLQSIGCIWCYCESYAFCICVGLSLSLRCMVILHARLLRMWSESWVVIQLAVLWAFADYIKGLKLALPWKLPNCNDWDCRKYLGLQFACNTFSAYHHMLAMMMHNFIRNNLQRWYFACNCFHPSLYHIQELPTAI